MFLKTYENHIPKLVKENKNIFLLKKNHIGLMIFTMYKIY